MRSFATQNDMQTHRCTASLLLRIPSPGTPATGTQVIRNPQTETRRTAQTRLVPTWDDSDTRGRSCLLTGL